MLRKFFQWLFRDHLWIDIPAGDPFSENENHGTHHFEYVSRHAIAESGLHCPMCHNEIAPLGDYRLVRHCRLGDVIRCNGTRQVNDEDLPCPAYLVASPDTEHGDHLIFDAWPVKDRIRKFYTFTRISEKQAVNIKRGVDVTSRAGELFASPVETPKAVSTLPVKEFIPGQIWLTDDKRMFTIARVQNDGDPYFNGWAWGSFLNETVYDWHVDPTGLIRQTMRDPTLKDNVRLTTELRPL